MIQEREAALHDVATAVVVGVVDLDADEALELLQSLGQEESGLDQLARIGFETLGLQTC